MSSLEDEQKPQESRNLFQRHWRLIVSAGGILLLLTLVVTSIFFVKKRTAEGSILAPGFVLRDQNGKLTSLAQFRGKVVVLTFIDPECHQICPLTTKSMVEALNRLGPAAASQVQLIGINANPMKTRVADVAAYTRVHELQGRWLFLTGSPAQLKRVWRNYHVYVGERNGDVVHEAVVFIIGRNGYERDEGTTSMSYESVGQEAQALAKQIATLLPGHPSIPASSQTPKQPGKPVVPSQTVSLTALGSKQQTVKLGGAHPRLLLFFAGWLGQESVLSNKLGALDRYGAVARKRNWPDPLAVDELTTEPSASEAEKVLTPLAAKLHTPIVQDATGEIADGYAVNDLPWFVLTSPKGKILWDHDGWLSAADLSRQVHKALAVPRHKESKPAPE